MLVIDVPDKDFWDSNKEEFINIKGCKLTLEHSLVSVSKWESKWLKPFLTKKEKTIEETIDYIRCMTLTQNVRPEVYYILSSENIKAVNDYISNPMTATWFNNVMENKAPSNEVITSELIYYWMIQSNIPVEFQKWHLNRLLTLIKVCSIKNTPQKKMSKREIMERNRALNASRKASMKSRG